MRFTDATYDHCPQRTPPETRSPTELPNPRPLGSRNPPLRLDKPTSMPPGMDCQNHEIKQEVSLEERPESSGGVPEIPKQELGRFPHDGVPGTFRTAVHK